jgi:hypothetical protein
MAAHSAGQLTALEAIALRLQLCMTLNEVEQRQAEGVKRLRSLLVPLPGLRAMLL